MEISLAFIWDVIYFCTMEGFFRILEKTSSKLICTQLYILGSCLFFCSPYLKIGKNRFSLGNNRFWRFVVFEEKITGFTFVTAFRYFPIIFQTRITGNRKITAFRTSPILIEIEAKPTPLKDLNCITTSLRPCNTSPPPSPKFSDLPTAHIENWKILWLLLLARWIYYLSGP